MPYPITTAIPTTTTAHTIRINFDETIRPTVLLHIGAGLLYAIQNMSGHFDPSQIGFKGSSTDLFPLISTLPSGGLTAGPPRQGGMSPIGAGFAGKSSQPETDNYREPHLGPQQPHI